MKRITLILVAVAFMLLLPINPASAQDASSVGFAGFRYDDGPLLSIGVANRLSGDIWLFNYTDLGHYGSLSTEISYFLTSAWNDTPNAMGFGLIAGPDVDWLNTNPDDEIPTISYLVGAGGFIGYFNFTDEVGIWGYGKYKFTFENDNLYQDGMAFGVGLHKYF